MMFCMSANTNEPPFSKGCEDNAYITCWRVNQCIQGKRSWHQMQSPPIISYIMYMSAIQMKYLSLTVFEKNAYFMYRGQSVHLRSEFTAPNESPPMISYMSLSLTFFEKNAYFMFRGQSVHLRSKVAASNESPPMVSYMSAIQMKALSLTDFEKNACFTFLPWPCSRSWPLALVQGERGRNQGVSLKVNHPLMLHGTYEQQTSKGSQVIKIWKKTLTKI